MLLGVCLLLATAASVTAVRKCCPQGSSLFVSDQQQEVECLNSTHLWQYMNFTFGLPDCNYTVGLASKGTKASCIDNRGNAEQVVALNCETEENEFTVPNVNYLRKCCPLDRVYDSHLQTCWGDQEPSWPTSFLNVLMYNADGVVDISIGVPSCPWNQVVVDHLVIAGDVYRDQTDSVSFKSAGENYIMNPDEVCLDRTERRDILVVRSCEAHETACTKHTCIRKCCPEGTSYLEEISTSCLPSNRSIRPMRVFNNSGDEFDPIVSKSLAYWYGMNCDKYLEYGTDKYFLDLTGSIYTYDKIKTEIGLFCLENVYNENKTTYKDGDFVFLCFDDFDDFEYSPPTIHVWNTLGMMASCFFLFLTLLVYMCLPNLQNLHGKTLMCHVSCLLAAYSGLVTVHIVTDHLLQQVCVILGFFVQFTFLAAFFWLNVISFDIWWNFGSMRPVLNRKSRDLKRFVLYSLYAWSVPCFFTAGSMVADNTDLLPKILRPNMGDESCWFTRKTYGNLLFFIGPEGIIVGCNVVLFTLTARHCSKVKNELDKVGHTAIADKKFESEKKKFIMNCKLFIVMGISWGLETLSAFVSDPPEVWYLSDMANACQGLLIFSIFVLKGRVINNIKRRLHGCCSKQATRRPSVSTLCTVSNISTNQLKKSASETRLSPLPMIKNPYLRNHSSNRLLV